MPLSVILSDRVVNIVSYYALHGETCYNCSIVRCFYMFRFVCERNT